jgi:hypothetical protein
MPSSRHCRMSWLLYLLKLELRTVESMGTIKVKPLKVPVWDFWTVVKSFLLDPILLAMLPWKSSLLKIPWIARSISQALTTLSPYDLCIDNIHGTLKQFFF